MERIRRRPFVPYAEAFEGFTETRKAFNALIENKPDKFLENFEALKVMAANENTIAMDLLAYYYKTGVEGLLEENYIRYITWELVAAARGNQFAIEKLQFLIGYGCDQIIACEDFETIKYKNDIDEDNLLYVLGKAVCKILVREKQYYPVDLYKLEDEAAPFKQEYFINIRNSIDEIVPKTIDFLKS